MGKKVIIAIDGGAGSGKSTVAELLAKRLLYSHVDSGAIYRTLTLAWVQLIGLAKDSNEFENLFLQENKKKHGKILLDLDIRINNKKQENYLSGKLVNHLINTKELTKRIKPIADDSHSRETVNKILRKIADLKESIVVDGRDIATVVFPNADYKFFLQAPLDVRVKRRLKQLYKENNKEQYYSMYNEMGKRDQDDENRKIGKLRKAPDAITLETQHFSPEQIVSQMFKHIRR